MSACRAATSRAGSDVPPKYSGGYGFWTGGRCSCAPPTRRYWPSKSTLLTGHQAPPDGQELVGHGVALVVTQKQAVAGELLRIAAGDDVDQQTPVGQPVEGGGHPARRPPAGVMPGRTATR